MSKLKVAATNQASERDFTLHWSGRIELIFLKILFPVPETICVRLLLFGGNTAMELFVFITMSV